MSQRAPRGDSRKGGPNNLLILLLLVAAASVAYLAFNAFASQSGGGAARPSTVAGPASANARAAPAAGTSSATPEDADSSVPTGAIVATPVPPFAPNTFADLQGIAKDDHGGIQFKSIRTDSVGFADCPQPKAFVLVNPQNPQAKQLASALLGYFFDQHLANDCGAALRAYRSEAEAGGPGTRGEVTLDVAGNPQTPAAGHSKMHTIAVSLPGGASFNVAYTPS